MSDLAKPIMEQFFTIHIESDEPTHSGWNGFDGDRYIDTNSMQIVTGNEEIYYFLGHGGRNTIVADGFIHDSQGRRVGANIKATYLTDYKKYESKRYELFLNQPLTVTLPVSVDTYGGEEWDTSVFTFTLMG